MKKTALERAKSAAEMAVVDMLADLDLIEQFNAHAPGKIAEAAISSYLKEMGTEAYAWVRDTGTFITNREYSQLTEASKQRYSPLFLAPSEDIEKLKAERDAWKRRGDNHWETLQSIRFIARTSGDLERIVQWVNDAGSGYTATAEATLAEMTDRAQSAEAERDAKASLLEEARKVLEPFAKAFDELREWSDLGEMTNHGDLSAAKSFRARLESPDAAK